MAAEVSFRAGKMQLTNRMLNPDPRKGLVRVFMGDEDGLVHLTWTSRETNVMEDDRIIFPGDADLQYVEQARNNRKNGRVYVLKFLNSAERMFFWMQEPSDNKDTALCQQVNDLIHSQPALQGGPHMGQMGQHQLLEMLTRDALADDSVPSSAEADNSTIPHSPQTESFDSPATPAAQPRQQEPVSPAERTRSMAASDQQRHQNTERSREAKGTEQAAGVGEIDQTPSAGESAVQPTSAAAQSPRATASAEARCDAAGGSAAGPRAETPKNGGGLVGRMRGLRGSAEGERGAEHSGEEASVPARREVEASSPSLLERSTELGELKSLARMQLERTRFERPAIRRAGSMPVVRPGLRPSPPPQQLKKQRAAPAEAEGGPARLSAERGPARLSAGVGAASLQPIRSISSVPYAAQPGGAEGARRSQERLGPDAEMAVGETNLKLPQLGSAKGGAAAVRPAMAGRQGSVRHSFEGLGEDGRAAGGVVGLGGGKRGWHLGRSESFHVTPTRRAATGVAAKAAERAAELNKLERQNR